MHAYVCSVWYQLNGRRQGGIFVPIPGVSQWMVLAEFDEQGSGLKRDRVQRASSSSKQEGGRDIFAVAYLGHQ